MLKIKTEAKRAWSEGFWSGFWSGVIIITLLWVSLAVITDYLKVMEVI